MRCAPARLPRARPPRGAARRRPRGRRRFGLKAGHGPDAGPRGSLTDLSDRLGAWTYALVGGLAFLETGAFVGLVAPGETAVVLGGVVAAEGAVDLVPILALAWAAAALGDLASFALGRRLGRRFMVEHGTRVGVTAARLGTSKLLLPPRRQGDPHRALRRHRARGRAVPGRRLRHAAAAFLPWSLLGTVLWSSAFMLVGYAFHESFSAAAGKLTHGALALAVIAAAVLAFRARQRAHKASTAIAQKS